MQRLGPREPTPVELTLAVTSLQGPREHEAGQQEKNVTPVYPMDTIGYISGTRVTAT
ncbi:hypothetical protein [Arthrobacter globiformis]|uniref:hypothetical protein n=1 Tax=Arthrobacter globiformis TaxID=1665 RepID=UPI001556AA23|nr:hypothetical protein [Arthrobacter globiformis]